MPIDITYDELIDCYIVKATGTIGIDDIIATREQMFSHPNFKLNLNKIIDWTDCDVNLTTKDVNSISRYFHEESDAFGSRRKIAFVALSDKNYGIARQFDAYYGSSPKIEVRTFRSMLEALDFFNSNK